MRYAEDNRASKPAQLLVEIALGIFALGMMSSAIAGDADRGGQLAHRWCSECHAVSDAGKGTDAAPAFSALAVDPEKSPRALRVWLLDPHEPMVDLELSRDDVDDLIAYIQSLDAGADGAQ